MAIGYLWLELLDGGILGFILCFHLLGSGDYIEYFIEAEESSVRLGHKILKILNPFLVKSHLLKKLRIQKLEITRLLIHRLSVVSSPSQTSLGILFFVQIIRNPGTLGYILVTAVIS